MSKDIPERRATSKAPGQIPLIRRIKLIKGDITLQDDVDAIVSTIGTDIDVGGSLNRAVIAAAGEKLDDFILEHVYKPRTGDVFAVPGFNLPVKNVIFVVTPPWRSGFEREDRDLLRCYRHAMQLAERMDLRRIAFPLLGTGKDKFPLQRAARLAVQGIKERLNKHFDEIRIVCNRDETFDAVSDSLGSAISDYKSP